jgi:hypothetical protein
LIRNQFSPSADTAAEAVDLGAAVQIGQSDKWGSYNSTVDTAPAAAQDQHMEHPVHSSAAGS